MDKPMEILSKMMARTDFGTSTRQRAGPSFRGDAQFEKVFEEAMTETASQKDTIAKTPDKASADNNSSPFHKQKSDDEEETSGAQVAYLPGNQQEVVTILEGDKESDTTPAVRVNQKVDFTVFDEEAQPQIKPEQNASDTDETKTDYSKIAENMIQSDETEIKTFEKHVENTGNASITKPEAENIEAKELNNGETAGDVSARMPNIRTSESQENTNSNLSSDNGNLGPLENENDETPVKGQKEKTFSETANAVRNAAEETTETANTAPPLTEGIKPEQFRATEQMKQVALESTVKPENLFDEMVTRVETMQNDSVRTMTLQLNPEHLGQVALQIAIDAAGLHVKIDAADASIRGMLSSQINALIEQLENKGIEVAEVEVAWTGVDNGAFKENREGHNQQKSSKKAVREVDPAEGAAYYAALPVELLEHYLDVGVSSVEYRA